MTKLEDNSFHEFPLTNMDECISYIVYLILNLRNSQLAEKNKNQTNFSNGNIEPYTCNAIKICENPEIEFKNDNKGQVGIDSNIK